MKGVGETGEQQWIRNGSGRGTGLASTVGMWEGTRVDFSAVPLGRDDLLADSTSGADLRVGIRTYQVLITI